MMLAPSVITGRICLRGPPLGLAVFAGHTVGTYRNDGAKRPVLQQVHHQALKMYRDAVDPPPGNSLVGAR